jgi:hypothetical protein
MRSCIKIAGQLKALQKASRELDRAKRSRDLTWINNDEVRRYTAAIRMTRNDMVDI